MFHAIAHVLGLDNGSGAWYLWWSGIVGDLGFLGAFVVFYRHHNCREHRCWRIGIHHYADADGQVHPACRVHHPTMKVGHRIHFADMHRHKQRIESERGSEQV